MPLPPTHVQVFQLDLADMRACCASMYINESTVSEDEGRLVITNEHFVALVPWYPSTFQTTHPLCTLLSDVFP
ncbi:hypothetical protein M405DRAFT_816927, partial [Rhizopogon salebrosus TDB-379]